MYRSTSWSSFWPIALAVNLQVQTVQSITDSVCDHFAIYFSPLVYFVVAYCCVSSCRYKSERCAGQTSHALCSISPCSGRGRCGVEPDLGDTLRWQSHFHWYIMYNLLLLCINTKCIQHRITVARCASDNMNISPHRLIEALQRWRQRLYSSPYFAVLVQPSIWFKLFCVPQYLLGDVLWH